jgi:hypothetical protein
VHAQLDRHLVLLILSCWADLLRRRFSSVHPRLIRSKAPAHVARWVNAGVAVLVLKPTKPVRNADNNDVFQAGLGCTQGVMIHVRGPPA